MKYHGPTAALAATFILSSTATSKPRLAFISPHSSQRTHLTLPATTLDELPSDTSTSDPESILSSRNRLLALSSTLSKNGRFVTNPSDKIKLQNAINELESASPSMGEKERDALIGDWTLVCTANVVGSDVRRFSTGKKSNWFGKRKNNPLFGDDSPISNLRNSIEVTQRIRTENDEGIIDRVDNVIEYTPLETLGDFLPKDSPLAFLGGLNVNPLGVKNSKVVLIHKAEVESLMPLRMKIAWVSSVLNVAGTSQFLTEQGSDIFGTNNPLGEFLNTGTFETPYVDDDVRISRSRGPLVEQLRVFVRKGSDILESDFVDSLQAELRVTEEVEGDEVTKVTNAAQSIGEAVSSIGQDVRSAVEKDMEGVSSALGNAMDDVVGKVQDIVEDDLKEIGEAVGGLQNSLRGEGDLVEAMGNVTKAVTKVPQDVRKVVEEDAVVVGESVEEALDAVVKNVQDSVEEDLKKIEDSVADVRDVVVGKKDDESESYDETND